jgi:hypothetical protein
LLGRERGGGKAVKARQPERRDRRHGRALRSGTRGLAFRPLAGASPRPDAAPESFDLVTFGAGGRFSSRNTDKTSALFEADDLERHGPRR